MEAKLERKGSMAVADAKVDKRVYPVGESEYKLLEEVGRGVSAIVYRAKCIPFGDYVAIKTLGLERCNSNLGELSSEKEKDLLTQIADLQSSVVQNHAPLRDLDHYVSVADLLGRTGCLDISNFLIKNMPYERTTLLLRVMLGACMYHADVDRTIQIAKLVMELDSDNIAFYVLLSNIYASTAHRHDCEKSLSAGIVEQMNEIRVPPCVVG